MGVCAARSLCPLELQGLYSAVSVSLSLSTVAPCSSSVGVMGDPEQDLNSMVVPHSVASGVYDYSETQDSHVYHENTGDGYKNKMGGGVTKEEIKEMSRMWWDGETDRWSTDAEFSELRNEGYKIMLGGCQYRLEQREAFNFDCQHIVYGRNVGDNTQCVVAHSDYTVCIAVSDPEEGKQC